MEEASHTPQDKAFVLRVERDHLQLPIDPAFVEFFRERLKDGVRVVFDIARPAGDTRAAFEDPEVRAWMQAFFILAMPEALATLQPDAGQRGLALVEACCNKVQRRDTMLSISISPAWQDACRQAGVEVTG